MRILGADLSRDRAGGGGAPNTLALLDDHGRVTVVRHPTSLPDLAATVADLAEHEPFLLGVNLPLVTPARKWQFRQNWSSR